MPLYINGDQVCWLCGGSGQVTTGKAERPITCGMCAGSGVADEVPGSTAEMVSMIAGMPGIERRTLTQEDYARIDEMERIVIQCLLEIEEEDAQAAQAGQSSTPAVADRVEED